MAQVIPMHFGAGGVAPNLVTFIAHRHLPEHLHLLQRRVPGALWSAWFEDEKEEGSEPSFSVLTAPLPGQTEAAQVPPALWANDSTVQLCADNTETKC